MTGILKTYTAFARFCCILAGWALMVMAFAATFEVFARKYFDFSFKGIDEVGGYMMAGVSAVGFAYALTTRAHMRVTLLFPYIPNWLRAILNVLAMVTLCAMAVFCAYRGYFEVADSIGSLKRSNTPLQVPLWIPQAFWYFGMVLFAVGTVFTALHSIGLLFTDTPTLNRLYGPQSLEEEISTEVGHAEAREGKAKVTPP
jgi:TRAP-type C4-dicarboxylate transport system permease small subunit